MKTLQEFLAKLESEGGYEGLAWYGVGTDEWKGTELEPLIQPWFDFENALVELAQTVDDMGGEV